MGGALFLGIFAAEPFISTIRWSVVVFSVAVVDHNDEIRAVAAAFRAVAVWDLQGRDCDS